MKLTGFDHIVINSSAGKDSQAMTDYVCRLASEQGVRGRVVMVHADLSPYEWPGTRELAEYHSASYGIPFYVVRRSQGLLEQIEERGMFPDSQNRYCTSDHKRDQIAKIIRSLCKEGRVLNCMGMRAEESPARAKCLPFSENTRITSKTRKVFEWLPLHQWTLAQVWERVYASGLPWHYAYDLGMPRLSCMLCIFAPPDALLTAGYYNRLMLNRYVGVEQRTGHTFRHKFTLKSIADRLDAGEEPPAQISDWKM